MGASAPAEARTLEDCEKIRDWHAYNVCLSSFGPRRGQRAATAVPAGVDPEQRAYGRNRAAARRGPAGLTVQRVAGGRVRASFDVSRPTRGAR